ncbi:uncharacterized protein [Henckelia pumila]|uniref:uncharacterized protein n=1 Tax=Henckelia pumila TaxID=405737 RepID=UPI003C6DBF2B
MGPMNVESYGVARIRTDHGKEFENSSFSSLCDKKGISQEFSASKTPQQNDIVERKNRTLQEMARVMMKSKNISKRFWAKSLNTTCHISSHVYLRNGSTMTSFEILMGKRPNLNYFHVFGCVCYVLNNRNHIEKFDSKIDKYFEGKTAEDDVEGLLEFTVEEPSVVPDVTTSSTTPVPAETDHEDNHQSDEETELFIEKDIPSKKQKNCPSSQIIGDVYGTRQTRAKDKVDYRKMVGFVCMSSVYSQVMHSCFVSNIEPKNANDALNDEFWVNFMHEELEQFVRNDVWFFVPPPDHGNVIGTKWIFKNKIDE